MIECPISDGGNALFDDDSGDTLPNAVPRGGRALGSVRGNICIGCHWTTAGNGQRAVVGKCPRQIVALCAAAAGSNRIVLPLIPNLGTCQCLIHFFDGYAAPLRLCAGIADFLQTSAELEGTMSNSGNAVGQCNLLQLIAGRECTVADLGNAVGQDDFREVAAGCKAVHLDGGNALRYCVGGGFPACGICP